MAWLAGAVPLVLAYTGADLTSLMSTLNKSIFPWANSSGRFVTLIAAALDPVAHRLQVAKAGDISGLLRRQDGAIEELCADQFSGLPLGVPVRSQFPSITFELGPGDAVVMASDGISGAVNPSGHEYGSSRLNEIVARTDLQAANLGEAVMADVKTFTSGQQIRDDVVMVCFSREMP